MDVAEFRIQRIRYAAVTSLGSKVMTVTVQVLALPIAIRALGSERFALYAMLAALLSWVGLANIGIGPALVLGIAAAAARGERVAEARLFTSAWVPVLCFAVVLGLGIGVVIQLMPVANTFGANYAQYVVVIRLGLLILLGSMLLQALLSVIEAAQVGYQEQYILNLWTTLGGLFTLAALVSVAKLTPTVIAMILAVNAPPLMARLLNSVRFMNGRPHLKPRREAFDWSESKSLLVSGLAFSLVGLGSFLNHQVPVVIVGRTLNTLATATFAAVMNVFMIGFGMVSMVAIPLWPAISDSVARGEVSWVRKAYHRLLSYSMLYAVLVCVVLILAGRPIMRLWFGQGIDPSQSPMAWLGFYFVLAMWEYVHYMVLVGLKRIRVPSLIYLGRSLLTVVLVSLLIPKWGNEGAIIGLCMSVLLVTSWSFPYLTHLALQKAEQAATNSNRPETA